MRARTIAHSLIQPQPDPPWICELHKNLLCHRAGQAHLAAAYLSCQLRAIRALTSKQPNQKVGRLATCLCLARIYMSASSAPHLLPSVQVVSEKTKKTINILPADQDGNNMSLASYLTASKLNLSQSDKRAPSSVSRKSQALGFDLSGTIRLILRLPFVSIVGQPICV